MLSNLEVVQCGQSTSAFANQLGQSYLNPQPIRVALDDETIQRIAKAVVRLLQGPPDPSIP